MNVGLLTITSCPSQKVYPGKKHYFGYSFTPEFDTSSAQYTLSSSNFFQVFTDIYAVNLVELEHTGMKLEGLNPHFPNQLTAVV